MAKIACLGDPATHPGLINSAGQTAFTCGGLAVAVAGATFSCVTHGVSAIIPIAVKSYCEGKLIVTEGAVTGCGATIQPLDRKVSVE